MHAASLPPIWLPPCLSSPSIPSPISMPAADLVRDCHCIREFCLRLDRVGHVQLVLNVRHVELLWNLSSRILFFHTWFNLVRLHRFLFLIRKRIVFPSILLHRGATCDCWPPIKYAGARAPCFALARRRPQGMLHSQPHRFSWSSFPSGHFAHHDKSKSAFHVSDFSMPSIVIFDFPSTPRFATQPASWLRSPNVLHIIVHVPDGVRDAPRQLRE